MSQTMEGKVAVVTGASRGIGKAIAVKLASKGATVVINYNGSRERAEEVKNEVESAGGKAVIIQCNVADFDACIGHKLEGNISYNKSCAPPDDPPEERTHHKYGICCRCQR